MKTNIIVIDDDSDTLFLLTSMLSTRKRESWGADSGEEAIRLLEITPRPCFVLLDIKLPDMSGVDVLGKILEMKDDMIDVVLMTAGMPSEYKELTDAGVTLLRKPLNLQRLEELVNDRCCRLDAKYRAKQQLQQEAGA